MTANGGSRPEFSVLMPLWRGDRPDRFWEAARSATLGQDLRPSSLVLTIDGPLGPELEVCARRIGEGELGPALVLRGERHRGIAAVLQDGLEAAPTPIIARADADDLCRPERFARQVPCLLRDRLDLLGSSMQEFSDTVPPGSGPLRRRPLTHDEILAYLPRHSPFHHPTVVLRRETALAAGGYRKLARLEDYWLWERMILAGARCANLADALVDYRVDADLFSRRGGIGMLVGDVRLQRIFLRDRVVGRATFAANIVRRGAYRLMPGWARRIGYRCYVERRAS